MTFRIVAKQRQAGNAEEDRLLGVIPAVVYGPEMDSKSIGVEYTPFEKLYDEAGESSLVDLDVEGAQPTKVLIQDVQYDPVKGKIIHVDFRQIKMGEEMTATIELRFVGETPAVKTLGGTLMKSAQEVNVRCLPKDLVGHIDVDLGVLQTFDDTISIGDVVLPAGVTVTDHADVLVAKVAPPLTEEQMKAMEETVETSVGDVAVEGEKKEGGEAGEKKEGGENKKAEKKKE
jgi:large subunit ribosomal protein L25